MRQSHLLAPTLRENPADAETASHQLMVRAGLIRQLAAGIYTFLPLGQRVLRKIKRIVREEMELAGAQEILLPALQPAELWKESGRYAVYGPELIRLTDRQEREFALGPTHEEVVTSLIRDEIDSYRKLPLLVYQIQTKFRDERRPRFGLLRSREFLMKDAYSFDTDWDGLDATYRSMYGAYQRIFERCGLQVRAVEADAGAIGGEGGSHEFMALADIGEDTIACCSHCEYAANLEQAAPGAACPACREGKLLLQRGIEIGHVFKLGTTYSERLGASFLGADGKERAMIMGCYGIGVSRMLSAVVEQRHDRDGILWPPSVAPFLVHLIPISGKDRHQLRLAEELYSLLLQAGIDVLLDDRDERPGSKFKDADLLGAPFRIIVGKSAEQGSVELKLRGHAESRVLQQAEVLEALRRLEASESPGAR
ncbi:proline--tRNA ligase [Paenibacillus puerhi]|uniref:proline--tRNA ligase n=1 Tax=Paenibacillus puerhi TaxID=2692622 RepID=UPI0013593992|nr:proline--tRNA ligase [Paenibacillus puerhi]